MALNQADRAFLEEDFAQFLEQIPSLVLLSRTEDYKMSIQSNGADDFVLGFTNGMLWVGFINYFVGRHMRELAEDETKEFFENPIGMTTISKKFLQNYIEDMQHIFKNIKHKHSVIIKLRILYLNI